jgi:iron(III) transport system substrate-binding protein
MLTTIRSSFLLTMLAVLIACDRNASETVTVYVSADDHIARQVFDRFTQHSGIEVRFVADSEVSKTTGLSLRLRRERTRPLADVFWSSEIIQTILLANDGILAPHQSQVASAWPSGHRDEDHRWFAFSPRARVLAYDPRVTPADALPLTWWDVRDAAMADPRFGTTGTHLCAMAAWLEDEGDPGRLAEFLDSVAGPLRSGGNAATVDAVLTGEHRFGMTDTDDVHAAMKRGRSVAMHIPRHGPGDGGGALLIPNTVGIVAGCAHPAEAATFVDFMLSDDVARMLANSASHNIPIQPHIASDFPELIIDDPLKVDWNRAAMLRDSVLLQVTSGAETN